MPLLVPYNSKIIYSRIFRFVVLSWLPHFTIEKWGPFLLKLYLIELLGLLTGLGLLELWHLIYPRLLTGFGMLVFFKNLHLMEFQVRYLALFLLFSVIDGFEWCSNLYCLICGNNLSWLLNLNLIYEILWTRVKSGFLISMLGKLIRFHLTGLITMALLMQKWMDLFLRKNCL